MNRHSRCVGQHFSCAIRDSSPSRPTISFPSYSVLEKNTKRLEDFKTCLPSCPYDLVIQTITTPLQCILISRSTVLTCFGSFLICCSSRDEQFITSTCLLYVLFSESIFIQEIERRCINCSRNKPLCCSSKPLSARLTCQYALFLPKFQKNKMADAELCAAELA